jgi:Skp family chaperone for outer membrane proteins
MIRRAAGLGAVLALALSVTAAGAQQQATSPGPAGQSDLVIVDSERLFAESLWGKRVADELEVASRDLQAENRRIEAALTTEEKVLTDKRVKLPAEEFRKLADEFDTRVTGIRQAQADKVRELQARPEEERNRFLEAARPVIGEVMTAHGAVAVLDMRAVFLSVRSADITDEIIAALDERLGDGL